jgi:uncharacterized small protein (DUF1192 family)
MSEADKQEIRALKKEIARLKAEAEPKVLPKARKKSKW